VVTSKIRDPKIGRLLIRRNRPHRNSIGNLKKFEKTRAPNTSFAETVTIKPGRAEITAIRNTDSGTAPQLITTS
jgi:hypothetical protein